MGMALIRECTRMCPARGTPVAFICSAIYELPSCGSVCVYSLQNSGLFQHKLTCVEGLSTSLKAQDLDNTSCPAALSSVHIG